MCGCQKIYLPIHKWYLSFYCNILKYCFKYRYLDSDPYSNKSRSPQNTDPIRIRIQNTDLKWQYLKYNCLTGCCHYREHGDHPVRSPPPGGLGPGQEDQMHLVSIRLQFDPPPSHCLRKQYENKRLFNPYEYAYCLILWLDAHCLCPKNVFHQLPTRGKWMTLTSPKLEYSSGIFNKQGTTSSSIQTCGTLVTHRPWPCSHPCYAFHTLFTCFTVISSQNIYKTYLQFVRNTYIPY